MKSLLFLFLVLILTQCSKNDPVVKYPNTTISNPVSPDVTALVGTFKGDCYSSDGSHYAPCTLYVAANTSTSVSLRFLRSPLDKDTVIANVSGNNITLVNKTISYWTYYGTATKMYSGNGTYNAPVLNMTITHTYDDPHYGTGNLIYTYAFTKQ